MLIKVTKCSRLGVRMQAKNPVARLRRYYDRLASEYDSFLKEELSLEETKSFLSLIPESYHDPLLDVASGTGRIGQEMSSRGLYYVGLDISDSMLRVLRKKTPTKLTDLVCGSATSLPFRKSGFEFITCFGLTGYFDADTQKELIREISAVLVPSGLVAIDFLRPSTQPSKLIQTEEAQEGNRVYLLSLEGVRERMRLANFKIIKNSKTPRQVQFLLRKYSGKD
jgi:ubiquinone/menaquinone biosynthesis C-methylase UbiE